MYDTLYAEQKDLFERCGDHLINRFDPFAPQIIKIDAPAGNGKTYTLRALVNFLQLVGTKITVACYTGRAASQLAKDGFSGARTLHSILYEPELDQDGNLVRWHNRPIPAVLELVGDGIVIDEASMVPRGIYSDIKAIGVPLILCGDKEQLPSITGPNVEPFDALSDDVPGETLTLMLPRRQKEGSGILDLCTHLRETNSLPRKCTPDRRAMPKSRIMNVDFHRENRFDAIICGTNSTVKKINNMVRKARGYNDFLPQQGETIMCIENTIAGERRLSNGELFIVDGVVPGDEYSTYFIRGLDRDIQTTVTVHNTTWFTYKPVDGARKRGLQSFVYGYAMTCHKAQGSTFERLLFVDEDVSYFLDQRRYRYTGVSRASEMLYIGV